MRKPQKFNWGEPTLVKLCPMLYCIHHTSMPSCFNSSDSIIWTCFTSNQQHFKTFYFNGQLHKSSVSESLPVCFKVSLYHRLIQHLNMLLRSRLATWEYMCKLKVDFLLPKSYCVHTIIGIVIRIVLISAAGFRGRVIYERTKHYPSRHLSMRVNCGTVLCVLLPTTLVGWYVGMTRI